MTPDAPRILWDSEPLKNVTRSSRGSHGQAKVTDVVSGPRERTASVLLSLSHNNFMTDYRGAPVNIGWRLASADG